MVAGQALCKICFREEAHVVLVSPGHALHCTALLQRCGTTAGLLREEEDEQTRPTNNMLQRVLQRCTSTAHVHKKTGAKPLTWRCKAACKSHERAGLACTAQDWLASNAPVHSTNTGMGCACLAMRVSLPSQSCIVAHSTMLSVIVRRLLHPPQAYKAHLCDCSARLSQPATLAVVLASWCSKVQERSDQCRRLG